MDGELETMAHTVNSCSLTKLDGGILHLHSADDIAVNYLTTYSS